MSDEARELQRIIGASVRDMLNAYRIQAQAGPVTDQALEEAGRKRPRGMSTGLTTRQWVEFSDLGILAYHERFRLGTPYAPKCEPERFLP
jgi:hypothetical protein